MNNFNKISKIDFLKLREEDVMFITNPGRMGDEDGITFIVKNGCEFTIYRVSGWMYGTNNDKEDYISLNDAKNQFPDWHDAWKNWNNENYDGKYKHIYMGFGNGLNIDNSIYSLFEPYVDELIKDFLEKHPDSSEYAAIYNCWKEAFMNMSKAEGYVVK